MAIFLIPLPYLVSIITLHPKWNEIGCTALAFLVGEQRAVVSTSPEVLYLPGCGTFWFVYTLILIKLIFNPVKRNFLMCSVPISLFFAYVMPIVKPIGDYAVFTLPLAWFFFVVGYFIMHSERFSRLHIKLKENIQYSVPNKLIAVCSIIILALIIYIVGEYNDMVKFFKSEYGNNLILMLIGSILGIVMIYLISTILEVEHVNGKLLTMVSNGTLIILAFHPQVIYYIGRYLYSGTGDLITFLLSLIIMLLFIPVIWLIFRYFPIMVGKRMTINSHILK